ncbi:Dirigent protein 23 [Hibiscus syriacus]|uniref:Dirigent protein n=1 Tax=Hibiscus syriacus TaxID=106335 RepID=A0A6A2X533_HIBSY|nr:dirigent protein 23-like [Hibiscus syriacus]KAE8669948.1 Dirigent protein 23 [Hibiscus syriacus]
MCKLSFILLIISLVAVMPWAAQGFLVSSWASTKLETKQEAVTNLQFYFHDTISGKNPTAIKVAQAAGTDKSPTLFGALLMADDPLTKTPDPNSKLLGRAQGVYGSAGKGELALVMAMSFCFTDGIYNGSSISVLGKNSAMTPVREMPVVGGTGVFRLARGYALAKTHWFNELGDAIVGYNVTIVH